MGFHEVNLASLISVFIVWCYWDTGVCVYLGYFGCWEDLIDLLVVFEKKRKQMIRI